jgi:hypothetical protein
MRTRQLIDVLSNLEKDKRVKFKNGLGWENKTMAINAILEEGNAYIFIWACHPKCIKDDMNERQKLIWYNPNLNNANIVKDYFPDYVP